MLVSINIKNWRCFKDFPLTFSEIANKTETTDYDLNRYYLRHNNIFIPTTIAIQGTCFSGKTVLFCLFKKLKEFVVDNQPIREKINVEIQFLFQNKIYKYVVTSNNGLTFDEYFYEGDKILLEIKSSEMSMLKRLNQNIAIQWFKKMIFINETTADQLNVLTCGNDLLHTYRYYIYNGKHMDLDPNVYHAMENGIHMLVIDFSASKKIKIPYTNLSRRTVQFISLLPIFDRFFKERNNILFIDDMSIFQDYRIKHQLEYSFVKNFEIANAGYEMQLITFSPDIKRNTFSEIKPKILKPLF